MQIAILNASPKRKDGNTAFFYNFFSKGLKDSGHYVTEFFLYDINGYHCTGCHKCWKTGQCVFSDDITQLINDLKNTPL